MDDGPPPLSLEEKNSLYMKAVVPFTVILAAFMAYFYYRMETSPFKTMLDALLEFGLPFMITATFAMMLTVEVFYHLKVRKPFKFHARRLGINALLICVLATSFFAVIVSVDATLSRYIGERRSMLFALVSWALLIVAITIKYQRTFRKYWKEP